MHRSLLLAMALAGLLFAGSLPAADAPRVEFLDSGKVLADIAEWATFNDVYRTFFKPPYPARSAFGASGLALGARVELECIAVVGD